MPLTDKGAEIKGAMTDQYGEKKGEQVFYASKNKGTITGVDSAASRPLYGAKRGRELAVVPSEALLAGSGLGQYELAGH